MKVETGQYYTAERRKEKLLELAGKSGGSSYEV